MKKKGFFNGHTLLNIGCVVLWIGCAVFDFTKGNYIICVLESLLVLLFGYFTLKDVKAYKVSLKTYEKNKFECKRNQLTIRGVEFKPKGQIKGIVVLSPDFLATSETLDQYAAYFANKGYIAYGFDFNGGSVMGGKSDGKTTDMSVLTEVEDLETVLSYVQDKNHKYAKDIILLGQGQGAFVSAIVASKLKGKIHKLVLLSPSLNIPDNVRHGYAMYGVFDPANIPDIIPCGVIKLGRRYVDDVMNMNAYDNIKNYVHDVLIIHGKEDEVVDVAYARNTYNTYINHTNNNRKVVLEIINDAKHAFTKEQSKVILEKIDQFLEK